MAPEAEYGDFADVSRFTSSRRALLNRLLPLASRPCYFWLQWLACGGRFGFTLNNILSRTPPDADADAEVVAAHGRQAAVRAQQVSPGAVLRQVYVNPRTGQEHFSFDDGPGAEEVTVSALPGTPPRDWQILRSDSPRRNYDQPGVELSELPSGRLAWPRS